MLRSKILSRTGTVLDTFVKNIPLAKVSGAFLDEVDVKILIGYATYQGQTRQIARHVADHVVAAGHAVELLETSDADDIDLDRFVRVILAAPVHASEYPRALTDFVRDHVEQLNRMPTLFLSVSLSAAGHDSEDWRGLDRILEDFSSATGWCPGRTEQIAGAYRPHEYDVFRGFIMRRIIARKDPEAALNEDKEYTNWGALDQRVDFWLRS
ncbi:flavodoxin domain-containing protein [Salipiger sp. PrR002]|uniref:flavodoxin domain-containing protein n=1 Tax=Salipiger sp. PrR002 TaxID=2706489 RepID=UPI0034CE92D7